MSGRVFGFVDTSRSARRDGALRARPVGEMLPLVGPPPYRIEPDYGAPRQVTCWCERTVVMVPLDEIRAGRTASCGRRQCRAPSETAA